MGFESDKTVELSEDSIKKTLVITITLIFLGIIIFSVSFFVAHISKGKDADQITYRCEEMQGFKTVEDKPVPVSFPSSIELKAGEEFSCEMRLPDDIRDDYWICYLSDNNTSVYVN